MKKFRVRFGHSDPAGIAYYPRFFEWFHDAFEQMFEEVLGEPYAEVLGRRRVGFPAVQTASEFRAPARFGDLVNMEIFLSRLSKGSATFEYRVRGASGLLATASVKVATMDLDAHRPTPMPEDIRTAFLPYVDEETDEERADLSRLR